MGYFKNMKYEIDSDTADNICKNVLCETIAMLKKNIKKTKAEIKRTKPTPTAYLEDLHFDEKYLEACKIVYDFFGGHLK
jgi:uncharacterized small protein (DUF1192 family)